MNTSESIYDATMRRCIGYQNDVEYHAYLAKFFIERNRFYDAERAQVYAALATKDAMTRLAALQGWKD